MNKVNRFWAKAAVMMCKIAPFLILHESTAATAAFYVVTNPFLKLMYLAVGVVLQVAFIHWVNTGETPFGYTERPK